MKKEIDIQNENIEELIRLTKENPNLRIVPMVDTDCVPGDDYSWWVASWGKPAIDDIWNDNEIVYLKSESYDDLVDKVASVFENDIEGNQQELAEKQVNEYTWEKVIAIKIKPL